MEFAYRATSPFDACDVAHRRWLHRLLVPKVHQASGARPLPPPDADVDHLLLHAMFPHGETLSSSDLLTMLVRATAFYSTAEFE
jgi:hypothetical protein